MKRNTPIAPIGGLVLLFVLNVAASPGGCGVGDNPEPASPPVAYPDSDQPTSDTADQNGQEAAQQSSILLQQNQNTTQVAGQGGIQPPPVTPSISAAQFSLKPAVTSTLTTNLRGATLEPLPGAPPRHTPSDPGTAFFQIMPRLQTPANAVFGQGTERQLKSFKLYITRMFICKDLVAANGILNNPSGCVNFYTDCEYQNSSTATDPFKEFGPTQAKSLKSKFVDFLDSKDLQRLSTITDLAGRGGADFGKCVTNDICDLDKGETSFNCPADCPSSTAATAAPRLVHFPAHTESGTRTGEGGGFDGGTQAKCGPASPFGGKPPNSYKYGVIEAFSPFYLTGEVKLSNGQTLVTRDSPVNQTGTEAGFPTYKAQPESLVGTPGTAQEMLIQKNGSMGGQFKFQKPFEITQADLDDNVQFALDLVFNPDAAFRGSSGGNNVCSPDATDKAGNVIQMPFTRVSPVPRRAGETTLREIYVLRLPKFDMRMEIYSIKEDASRAIYGIDTRTIFAASTPACLSDPAAVDDVVSLSSGKLEFQQFEKKPMITDFTRLSVVGESAAAKFDCVAAFGTAATSNGSCSSGLTDAPYTLTKIQEVK